MPTLSHTDPLIAELRKVLGMPKHVRWFELRAAVGEPVTVRCEYMPDANGDADTTRRIVETYELVRRPPD